MSFPLGVPFDAVRIHTVGKWSDGAPRPPIRLMILPRMNTTLSIFSMISRVSAGSVVPHSNMHVCVLLKNLADEDSRMYIKGSCIVFNSSLQLSTSFPSTDHYSIRKLVSE
jgi:hypothetical protein